MAQATTLQLDHTFSLAAGQTFTFDILGEAVSQQTADESIILHVPTSTMNTLLTYSSSWAEAPGSVGASGYQPLPAVVLRLKTVLGDWLDSLGNGLTGATAGASYAADAGTRLTVAGDENNVSSLVYHFQNIAGFTYHDAGGAGGLGAETNYLAAIPAEAIFKFETSDLTATPLSDVTGDLVAIPSPGATGSEPGLTGAVQSLFEQAVNAGMVTVGPTGGWPDLQVEPLSHPGYATLGDVEAATAQANAPVYGVQWTADQTLGLFVRYDLTKTRTFQLSSDLGSANALAATEIAFGGVTFDMLGDTEASTPVAKTYQIVLKAVGGAI